MFANSAGGGGYLFGVCLFSGKVEQKFYGFPLFVQFFALKLHVCLKLLRESLILMENFRKKYILKWMIYQHEKHFCQVF